MDSLDTVKYIMLHLFSDMFLNKSNAQDNNELFLCVDGPSGSGKSTIIDFMNRIANSHCVSVLDTNVFMKSRCDRNDNEKACLFRSWYRVALFKEKLLRFLDTTNNIVIDNAYKHDKNGDSSHCVVIPSGDIKILLGRYSLHDEIQSIYKSQFVNAKKIIIDAPPDLRLHRVKKRALIQNHRTTEEQEKLIINTVDPDWHRYFPTIFFNADLYIVNYSDTSSVCRMPKECVNRDHVWGAYADLHIQPKRIYRLIEIGENGATSLHVHKKLNEIYRHVLGGPLGVILKDCYKEKKYVLTPGSYLTIPHGVYHKAYAVNNNPPVYYETVLPVNGLNIEPNDIQKVCDAKPMIGSLKYLVNAQGESNEF